MTPKIIVIGDVMLDCYIWGSSTRLSQEAPVAVVRHQNTITNLGGAGNVAMNLRGLECDVFLLGVCGEKRKEDIFGLMSRSEIEGMVFLDDTRCTTIKTRVMGNKQQIVRYDQEETRPIRHSMVNSIYDVFYHKLEGTDIVILSDYNKGVLTGANLCQRIIKECRNKSIPVLVDPKGKDWSRYEGATCITPNLSELVERETDKFQFNYLLLTKGAEGMCLTDPDKEITNIPATSIEVVDVSGAGDTVIATLAYGLASKLSWRASAMLANQAAGIVVNKIGTQVIFKNELIPIKTVFTNGCFDILHKGHLHILKEAAKLGGHLTVGLNSDESIKRLKGKNRPINNQRDRAFNLMALSYVNSVIIFDEDTPEELIKRTKPDILVKGGDWIGKKIAGDSIAKEIVFINLLKGYSTTNIIDKIRRQHGSDS